MRIAVAVAAVVCLLLLLRGFYRRELYHLTGAAQWLWVTGEVQVSKPTAGVFFFPFTLHDRPSRAVAKVCGDRQYALWINGQLAASGRNRPGFRLVVVPVTDLMTAGRNVIAVEARSPTSVGAVLFALDLEPSVEGRRAGDPRGRNVVVSGPMWRVATSWSPGMPADVPARTSAPWVWGKPPDHPWSYPDPVFQERPLIQAVVGEPRRIDRSEFRPCGEACWAAPLGGSFAGLVRLHLDPAAAPVRAARIAGGRSEGGAGSAATADVLTVPGQRSWLFPGRVSGQRLEAIGPAPPLSVELVETIK